MAGFQVVKSGILSLLQDAGRFGYYKLGLTNGGPVDTLAFRWANRLCGNSLNETAIEVTLGGAQLVALQDMVIAVTGAQIPLTVNRRALSLWRSHNICEGDILHFGYAKTGLRCYLAVAGGFQLESQFGSTTTVVREGIGGLSGGCLDKDDVLPAFKAHWKNHRQLPLKHIPSYPEALTLKMVLGYQYKYFGRQQKRQFFRNQYVVTADADRMGYRLKGVPIGSDISSMLSEGIALGSVQFPPDGQPIVLLNDRQTIGGYPKLGCVIPSDLNLLSQCKQGQKIRFEAISYSQAREIRRHDEQQFAKINTEII